jgi:hypothetical protein
MSGKWNSIERASCARAVAVSVTSWAMAIGADDGQPEAVVVVDARTRSGD